MSAGIIRDIIKEFAGIVELKGFTAYWLDSRTKMTLEAGAERMAKEVLEAAKKEAPVGERWTEDPWSWAGGSVDHGRPSERLVPHHTLREGWVDPPFVGGSVDVGSKEATAFSSVESIAGHIETVILGSRARSFGPAEQRWLAWRRPDNEARYPHITNEAGIAFARHVGIGARGENPFHERAVNKSRSMLNAIFTATLLWAGDEYISLLRAEARGLIEDTFQAVG